MKADQCADQKLKLVEIMEETLVDDANSEREEVDRNENILFCNKEKNKTTKKIKTYVYQVSALVQLKKVKDINSHVRFNDGKVNYVSSSTQAAPSLNSSLPLVAFCSFHADTMYSAHLP